MLHRYRNITVLLLVIFAQLALLGYQVRTNSEVRLIRIWSVTAVTPLARVLETAHDGTMRVLNGYVLLHDVSDENRRLHQEVGRLKLQNQFLVNELSTAEHAGALAAFQARTPSRTIPARVIGTGTGANSKVVFVDRGSASGVMKGMAVITPDGIVGRVLAAYPTASQVLLITDPTFAAGVISQRHRVLGVLKGQGQETCKVDYVQNEEKVEVGEIFYTSGDDRVFPKGLPAGVVKVVRPGSPFKDIFVAAPGLQSGMDEVLIVLEGVHQQIPEYRPVVAAAPLLPAPQPETGSAQKPETGTPPSAGTTADRLVQKYTKIGEAQNHLYGEGPRSPNFNLNPDAPAPKAAAPPKAPPTPPTPPPSGPTEAPPPTPEP